MPAMVTVVLLGFAAVCTVVASDARAKFMQMERENGATPLIPNRDALKKDPRFFSGRMTAEHYQQMKQGGSTDPEPGLDPLGAHMKAYRPVVGGIRNADRAATAELGSDLLSHMQKFLPVQMHAAEAARRRVRVPERNLNEAVADYPTEVAGEIPESVGVLPGEEMGSGLEDALPAQDSTQAFATPEQTPVGPSLRGSSGDVSGGIDELCRRCAGDDNIAGRDCDQCYRAVVSLEVMKDVTKVYFFGDLHGDLFAFQNVKRMLNLDDQQKKETLIVSTGDFVDRGPDDMVVWGQLKALREEGYKIVYVLGNHEQMLLSGDWRYRNFYSLAETVKQECETKKAGKVDMGVRLSEQEECMGLYSQHMEREKENVLTCSGDFNRFVRDTASSVALLKHPNHDESVLVSHAGVQDAWFECTGVAGDAGNTDLKDMVTMFDQTFRVASQSTCAEFTEMKHPDSDTHSLWTRFEPPQPPMQDSLPFDDAINGGSFGAGEKSMGMAHDVDQKWEDAIVDGQPRCKLAEFQSQRDGGASPTPSWDRSMFYGAMNKAICPRMNGLNNVRQVVGHTNTAGRLPSFCGGKLFGIDTSMSRGTCRRYPSGQPCTYSVLVFENFGTKEWTTSPIIYRKSLEVPDWPAYGVNDLPDDSTLLCEELNADTDTEPPFGNPWGLPVAGEATDRWTRVDCGSIGEGGALPAPAADDGNPPAANDEGVILPPVVIIPEPHREPEVVDTKILQNRMAALARMHDEESDDDEDSGWD